MASDGPSPSAAERNEVKQAELESQGYEREEEVYERDLENRELCEETGGVGTDGETEFR
jgi:hypothetical protein